MREEMMEALLKYAWELLARTHRYHIGGQNPIRGFDCSGYVMELLMAAGEIPHGTSKLSAQMLYDRYAKAEQSFRAGALAFFGSDVKHIVHVGFCINSLFMLEAAGGDFNTDTDEEAIARNAFLKMRPIHYRKDFLTVLRPSYAKLSQADAHLS